MMWFTGSLTIVTKIEKKWELRKEERQVKAIPDLMDKAHDRAQVLKATKVTQRVIESSLCISGASSP